MLFFFGLACACTWGVVIRVESPVHAPVVSPRELTGSAVERRTPPGARGGVQILGHGEIMQNIINVVAIFTAHAHLWGWPKFLDLNPLPLRKKRSILAPIFR